MPTVAELVRWRGPLALDVCSGASGLSREISRIVRFSTSRLDIAMHAGDVVLLSFEEFRTVAGANVGLRETFADRDVAAVIVSASGDDAGRWSSDVSSTPILLLSEPRIERAAAALDGWLAECRLREEREAAEILEELDGVVPSQTEPVAARLAQLSGKCVLLHDAYGSVERVCQPVQRSVRGGKLRDLDAGIRAAAEALRRRLHQAQQPAIGLTYDDVPVADLAMLSIATLNADCSARFVSLLAPPSEFAHRDSAALAAMFATLRDRHADQPTSVIVEPSEPAEQALLGWLLQGRLHQAGVYARQQGLDLNAACIGLAVRSAADAPASACRDRLATSLKDARALLHVEDDVVLALVPAVGALADRVLRRHRVLDWQAAMCTAEGPPSVGYTALHVGVGGARRALVEAKEALSQGELLFGAGKASSFAEVCIRTLVSRVDDDPALRELRARVLGPLLFHDQSHKNDLLPTLQTYLDTGCRTVQTAELLGVHRNSVLYRLQRIVELSHVDLEDADTRWLLQLALQSESVRPELRPDERLRARDTDLVWSRVDPLEVAPIWTSESGPRTVNAARVED